MGCGPSRTLGSSEFGTIDPGAANNLSPAGKQKLRNTYRGDGDGLIDLLTDPGFHTASGILACPAVSDDHPLMHDMAIVMVGKNVISSFFDLLILNNGEWEDLMLDLGNATFFTEMCRVNASTYIASVLREVVEKNVLMSSASYEVDPDELDESEDLKRNQKALLGLIDRIFDHITSHVELVPRLLRLMCAKIRLRYGKGVKTTQSDDKNTTSSSWAQAVGSLMFSYCLNPALRDPEAFGLTNESVPSFSLSALSRVAAVFEKIVANQRFGDEDLEFMHFLNAAVDKHFNAYHYFLDKVARQSSKAPPGPKISSKKVSQAATRLKSQLRNVMGQLTPCIQEAVGPPVDPSQEGYHMTGLDASILVGAMFGEYQTGGTLFSGAGGPAGNLRAFDTIGMPQARPQLDAAARRAKKKKAKKAAAPDAMRAVADRLDETDVYDPAALDAKAAGFYNSDPSVLSGMDDRHEDEIAVGAVINMDDAENSEDEMDVNDIEPDAAAEAAADLPAHGPAAMRNVPLFQPPTPEQMLNSVPESSTKRRRPGVSTKGSKGSRGRKPGASGGVGSLQKQRNRSPAGGSRRDRSRGRREQGTSPGRRTNSKGRRAAAETGSKGSRRNAGGSAGARRPGGAKGSIGGRRAAGRGGDAGSTGSRRQAAAGIREERIKEAAARKAERANGTSPERSASPGKAGGSSRRGASPDKTGGSSRRGTSPDKTGGSSRRGASPDKRTGSAGRRKASRKASHKSSNTGSAGRRKGQAGRKTSRLGGGSARSGKRKVSAKAEAGEATGADAGADKVEDDAAAAKDE